MTEKTFKIRFYGFSLNSTSTMSTAIHQELHVKVTSGNLFNFIAPLNLSKEPSYANQQIYTFEFELKDSDEIDNMSLKFVVFNKTAEGSTGRKFVGKHEMALLTFLSGSREISVPIYQKAQHFGDLFIKWEGFEVPEPTFSALRHRDDECCCCDTFCCLLCHLLESGRD